MKKPTLHHNVTPSAPTRRRWLRRGIAVILLLTTILVVAFFTVTRGPLARSIVLAQLRALSDAAVEIRSATINPNGTIAIEGLSITASTLDGSQARVLEARAATVTLSNLTSGSPTISSIDIAEPILRLSRDMTTGTLNIAAIHLRPSGGTGSSTLPVVTVAGGILELGEHDSADYHLLRRLPVDATLKPTDEPDTHILSIEQQEARNEPFRLTATIRADRTEVAIDALDLSAWPNDAVPANLRDLHNQLALKGQILPTNLTISNTGQIELGMQLQGVELNLPVDQAPLARGRMTEVDGKLQINAQGLLAELTGLLDGVPATATVIAANLNTDSPFTCKIHIGRVKLAENLERLGYIPEFVREQLEVFSNPTAEVALDLTLVRENPSDEPKSQGFIHIYDGIASYRDFPYEFENLNGTLELAGDQLILRDIKGDAPSGAHLEATGIIGPLGPIAEAKIDIKVTNVPLNSQLRTALGEQHMDLYDSLLSREHYQKLHDQKLILTPREARDYGAELSALRVAPEPRTPEQRARIQELEELLERPPFALGGRSSVDINIYRYFGEESRWDTSVAVHIPRAGFLPEQFPLPIIAEDITIRINNNTATITQSQGLFHTLAGGIARVDATADLTRKDALPTITIEASAVPLTPLLINAIPGEPNAPEGSMNARNLLNRLGLNGTIDCTALIGHPDHPAFDINVRPLSIAATIAGWTPQSGQPIEPLTLTDITGSIHADPTTLALDLAAHLSVPEAATAQFQADIAYGDAVKDQMQIQSLNASIPSLALTQPVEQLIAWVDPAAAEQLWNMRERFNPAGTVAVALTHRSENDATETEVYITDARDLSIRARELDIAITESVGQIILLKGHDSTIILDNFGGPVRIDNQPFAHATLTGQLSLATIAGETNPTAPDTMPSQLQATLTDAIYNQRIVDRLLSADSGSIRELLAVANPEGTLDLTANIEKSTDHAFHLASLRIIPHQIAFTHNRQRIALTFSAGSFSVQDQQVELNQLAFNAADWSGTINGRLSTRTTNETNQQTDADLAFTLRADALTPELAALVPAPISTYLEQLSITVAGPIQLDGGHLLYTRTHTTNRLDILGRLTINDAALALGIDLDRVQATIDFVAHTDPSLDSPEFELQIDAPEFRAAHIWMTNGSGTVRSSADGQAVEINPIIAQVHGGRVAASAIVWNSPDNKLQYDFQSTASGVRFAPILRDLALDTAPPEPAATITDESRGVIDARFTMHGLADGPRRGIGHLQVANGRVLKLPLLVPLIEVSNLALPMGEQLDLARARFYLFNDQITFEELSVLSRSIELIGYGTLHVPDQQLDLRVTSRSNTRIPLLSPVFEGLRDELVTIRVQGTLGEPDISTNPLTNTRAAIATLFGRERSSQEKLLADIKRQAFEFRERSRLSSKQIKTTIENFEQQGNNENQ